MNIHITWTASHASRAEDLQADDAKQESQVSYLPLSHIISQICDLWVGIQWSELVYFAQPDALKLKTKSLSQILKRP